MKLLATFLLTLSCIPCSLNLNAQNVGIGTTTPLERLHVTQTANSHKNVIYSFASQTATGTDYQNSAVTGFGQGNGVAGGYGYGFGVKGIGSTNGYGAAGLYGAIGSAIPTPSLGNNYYALYADAITPAANNYAGVFMNGNVGIGTNFPGFPVTIVKNADVWHTSIGGFTGALLIGGQTANGAVMQSINPTTSAARDLYLQRDG